MQKDIAEEKIILTKISRGDSNAFAVLFNFYRNKVYGYAIAILKSEKSAEEIVQNVFIKIWLKREDLSSVDNFGAYLRTISRNETLNALKHIATTHKHEQLIIRHSTELDLDTENTIQYRETKQLLDSAIQKLPAQQKLVYTLCHIEGVKQKDVAEKLNISPLTVKVHLREAVKSIRHYLEMHDGIRIVPLLLYLLK